MNAPHDIREKSLKQIEGMLRRDQRAMINKHRKRQKLAKVHPTDYKRETVFSIDKIPQRKVVMNKESDGSSMFNDEYQTSREGPVFQNEELNTVSHALEYLAPKYQMEPKTILYADLQGQQCYKLKATGSTMKTLQNQKQAKIRMRER